MACGRWPEGLRLRSSLGELVRGRCRATNLCPYCAQLAAVETSELLMLDAMEDAPTLYAVLTARELLDRAACRDHLQHLTKSLRKRWPEIRWAVLVEFQRRGALHLNLLVKGVPAQDRDELHERMSALWCSRVDAEPVGQFVGEVSDGGGLVRYIALHFLKPAQAPPIGWRGHRVSYSRSYLVRPASELREQARRSLRFKRQLYRLIRAGHAAEDVERLAADAMAIADATSWELVRTPIEKRPVSELERTTTASVPAHELVAALIVAFDAEELEAGPTDPARRRAAGEGQKREGHPGAPRSRAR